MNNDILNVLSHSPIFKGLSNIEIEGLIEKVDYRFVTFDKSDSLLFDDGPCFNVDIILDGEMVARMMGESGRLVEVMAFKVGELLVPCHLFLPDNGVSLSVEAGTKVKALRFSSYNLKRLVDSNEIVRWNFIRILSNVGMYLASRIKFLSLLTVKEKVVRFLCNEVRRQHTKNIVIDHTRQRIADFFAIQKFSLLRCFSDLSQKGIVSINGRCITILDFDRLLRYY